jgi:hypothetical protein
MWDASSSFRRSIGVMAFWRFIGRSTFSKALKRAFLKAGSWFWLPET